MLANKRIIVVLPAYNAEQTLHQTVAEIDRTIVDEIILVDDCSRDSTVDIAKSLALQVFRHTRNKGYGGTQKSCYGKALANGADIVVMLHPDYQYTPKLLPALAAILTSGEFDVALGSRILGGGALKGGMPLYKYVSNRILTLVENILTGMKLSEYHTGYRAFTREVLDKLPLHKNSDDFVFDNQMLLQAHMAGFRIAEVTCPTKYFPEASSIDFRRSLIYGIGCIWMAILYRLARWKFFTAPIFRIP